MCGQVFCTVSGAGGDAVKQTAKQFNTALVDEAAQLVEAEACILLAVRTWASKPLHIALAAQGPSRMHPSMVST